MALQDQDDNALMAYWLSNTSALLFLLEQSLKTGTSTNATPNGKPPNPTSLFGRMTKVIVQYYKRNFLISIKQFKMKIFLLFIPRVNCRVFFHPLLPPTLLPLHQ